MQSSKILPGDGEGQGIYLLRRDIMSGPRLRDLWEARLFRTLAHRYSWGWLRAMRACLQGGGQTSSPVPEICTYEKNRRYVHEASLQCR